MPKMELASYPPPFPPPSSLLSFLPPFSPPSSLPSLLPPFLLPSFLPIGTHVVVQLFNAVSKQQKELESKLKEAGPSERKKAKG